MYNLLEMFDTAEVIFGCEEVLSFSLQEIIAFQNKVIERIRGKEAKKRDALLSRIEDGSVHFFVARTQLSHEKIYLLSSDDGRKRVIMGSANMSYKAFDGAQRENICFLDDAKAYDWYYDVFMDLQQSCTDEISKKAIVLADVEENLDELPIAGTVKTKRALVIEPIKENNDDVQFMLDVRKLAEKLKPIMPKSEKKTGRIMVSPEIIMKLRRHIKDENTQRRELRSEYPQLVVNAFDHTVTLNDETLNLSPNPDAIKNDVELFLKYMEGYIRHLSLENYFSEQVTGKYAIKTIRTAWKTSRKSFVITQRNNELRYNAGAPYEADRVLKELPETLEARKSREWVVSQSAQEEQHETLFSPVPVRRRRGKCRQCRSIRFVRYVR